MTDAPPPPTGEVASGKTLSHAEASQSPCLTCGPSPCCQALKVYRFLPATFLDMDHARFVLNFPDILLGLAPSGMWTVYLCRPCAQFDLETSRCRVHGTADQPHVCEVYNPLACWYRTVFGDEGSREYQLLDQARLDFVLARTRYDEERKIVERPTWPQLLEGFQDLPVVMPRATAHKAKAEAPEAPQQHVVHAADSHDPCRSCGAYCCGALVFRQDPPRDQSALDFFRYALGFQGVTLGLDAYQWNLVVQGTCRHLEGNRCGIFGQPERPAWCKYYDSWQCVFKERFEEGSGRLLEVDQALFPALARALPIANDGSFGELPAAPALRELLRRA